MNARTPVPALQAGESVFYFDGNPVRVYDIGGKPWIAATDLARDLGYREAHDLTRSLDEDEKGPHSVRTLGGMQTILLVSEPQGPRSHHGGLPALGGRAGQESRRTASGPFRPTRAAAGAGGRLKRERAPG